MRALLLLVAAIALGCVAPQQAEIVFDYNHANRHTIEGGNENYRNLHDQLVAEGYPVEVWEDVGWETWATLVGCPADACGVEIPRVDVDFFVIAVPQVPVANGFLIAWLERWVFEYGGVLFLIGDHTPYGRHLNYVAEIFGARFLDTHPIIGDGVSHCPPDVPLCLSGHITYMRSLVVPLFDDVEWVTTYAGTSLEMVDPAKQLVPIFRVEGGDFSTQFTGEPRNGEVTFGFVPHGRGAVVLAGEAGMFRIPRNFDGEWNDDFIVNLFEYFRLLYVRD